MRICARFANTVLTNAPTLLITRDGAIDGVFPGINANVGVVRTAG